MKLAALLTLSLSALLAAGASAEAASVQHATKSPAQVAAYWTKDRMLNAVPRENARGGEPRSTLAGSSKGGSSSWTSFGIPLSDYSTGQNADNGKVFFTENGTNYVCSGTSVATATGSLVWTAGHCVNEGPGAYVTNWMFAPAWVDGTAPYGRWAATTLATTDEFKNQGDLTYDFGVARVAPGAGAPVGGTLSNIAAPRSMAFNYPVTVNSTKFKSYGYPAAGKFNGQRMWVCDSTVTRRDGSASNADMGIGCDMTGGSSGGGWVDSTGAVGSLNSYHYNSIKNTMFGPYQGTVAQALYSSMG